ncbi:unnamed protein product [Lathyrus oleraceus]
MARGRGRPKKKVLSSVVHPLVNKENFRKSVEDDDNKRSEGETIEDGEEEAKSQTLEGKPSQEMITDVTEEIERKKLWVDVISGNHVPTNGMAIEFVAPKIVEGEIEVEIDDSDVESERIF